MLREIAGRQNHSVKLVRKLQHKKHRRDRGLLVCEGMDLLKAALQVGADIREVLVRDDLVDQLPLELAQRARNTQEPGVAVDIGVCDESTLEYASSLGGGADVIFTCSQPTCGLGDLALSSGTSFYLDAVGDPGNVGTIVRSALAFGLLGVICSPGTADPFSPKAMRAGMGSQFLLPVVTEVTHSDLMARMASLAEKGERALEVVVADPHQGIEVGEASIFPGCLVVLGAERTGPGHCWENARRVTIPHERAESLNVAMAGAILAYESSRERSSGVGGN